MLMGTSSHVGKSILTTALCRIFHQDGRRVVPFKAQNMALNSFVTRDGDEMGRAQVAQAEAAGLEPFVDMNPVLLKPTGDAKSQVVLMGKPVGNMTAREYHRGYSLQAFDAVKEALARLDRDYDTIVIEGAGSPAEVNLKANDIVNMRVAKYLHAPVLLVADIDRGGALAALVGTLELLEEDERALVRGLIINKFRGDVSLLQPALDFLEAKTGKPVLGVVHHIDSIGIDEEDSVSLDEMEAKGGKEQRDLHLAVIRTPKISNFTDFDALAGEEDVRLTYVRRVEELGQPDLVLLGGSKNTSEDLQYIKTSGLADAILARYREGTPIIGICGGYQMLGERIADPLETESSLGEMEGLALLGLDTVFAAEKETQQATACVENLVFCGERICAEGLVGYEIHTGQTRFTRDAESYPFTITRHSGAVLAGCGTVSEDGLVFGTYLHGLFDHDGFRRAILNALRRRKGLAPVERARNLHKERQVAYDRLADKCRASLDIKTIYRLLEEQV